MVRKGINPVCARILILGLAFKEDCPDLRNTRVVDLIETLRSYSVDVDVHDPWVNANEALDEFGLTMTDAPAQGAYDAIILAVAHEQFRQLGATRARNFGKPNSILFDIKHIFPRSEVDARL